MEKDHSALLADIEQCPGSSVLNQVRSHFINAAPQRFANGHPDRPSEFHCLDVLANAFPVFRGKLSYPIPHRFSASLGAKEDRWDSFTLFFERPGCGNRAVSGFGAPAHSTSVPYKVHLTRRDCE